MEGKPQRQRGVRRISRPSLIRLSFFREYI